ncbi:MAG TPA: FHA domain-containing protein [Pirellulaceae bacterium]|nr:FHA domain-containing protein [Pirellulaceae bacterium]
MWPFSNPLECKVAEQCLARDNPLEAARVLLASRQVEHRAVRELLARIGPLLVAQSRAAADADDVLVAAELLEVAAVCGELPPDDQMLLRRLQERRTELARDREWRERRLDRAAEWARAGRLRSAIGLVGELERDADAARHRLDWQFDLDRLDRYAAEFQTHLAAGEFDAAAAVLAKASQLANDEPQVLAMRQALDESRPTPPPPMPPSAPPPPPIAPADPAALDSTAAAPAASVSASSAPDLSSAPEDDAYFDKHHSENLCNEESHHGEPLAAGAAAASDRSQPENFGKCWVLGDSNKGLVLSRLDAYGEVLVLTRPHLLIGTPRERGVDVPITARLHGRHAVLVRELVGRGVENWRIVPLGAAGVQVNGGSLSAPESQTLRDGDLLQFGSDLCRFTFRQPLVDSATAVLEVVRPTAVGVALPGGATVPCVALVADRLVLASDRREGHLVQRDLPVRSLTLEPALTGWRAWAEGGPVFPSADRLPTDLTLYADEIDLSRLVVSRSGEWRKSDKWTLNLRPVAR